jgi:hypothetical protein
MLAGVVAAAGPGVSDYTATLVRILLLGASAAFLCLLLRPVALDLDRRAVAWLVFAFLALLAALLSPKVISSLARLEVYYAIFVAGLAVGLLLPRCVPGTTGFALLAIAVVHAGFLAIALQSAHAAVGKVDPVSAPPYFFNVRHFGYQGFFGAAAALALGVTDARLRATGTLLATAALFGIVVFGSRGALLAWLVVAAAAFALAPDRRVLSAVGVVALAGALGLAVVSERLDWFNTISLFDRALASRGDMPSVFDMQSRIEIWNDSLPAIAHRPLLGYGPEGYQISRCCNSNVAQPHNSILQVLLEFGVLGLAALTWAAIALFQPAVRAITGSARADRDPVGVMALAIIAGYGAFSLIDGLAYHAVALLNFALVCAVFLASRPRGAPDPSAGDGAPATRSRAS